MGIGAESLPAFAELVRSRRSTRHSRPDPVPPDPLDELREAARWAPGDFNLLPTHSVGVTDPDVDARLDPACMKRRQDREAGALDAALGYMRAVLAARHQRTCQEMLGRIPAYAHLLWQFRAARVEFPPFPND